MRGPVVTRPLLPPHPHPLPPGSWHPSLTPVTGPNHHFQSLAPACTPAHEVLPALRPRYSVLGLSFCVLFPGSFLLFLLFFFFPPNLSHPSSSPQPSFTPSFRVWLDVIQSFSLLVLRLLYHLSFFTHSFARRLFPLIFHLSPSSFPS